MTKPLQALIALTCVVVIACAGWWMLDKRATAKATEEHAQFMRDADAGWRLAECKAIIREFDTGDTGRAESKWGSGAETAINSCRQLVEIDEIRRSKPSE